MEQSLFGGGLCVVVLLVLAVAVAVAVALAVRADDPAFLIALHVDLARVLAPAEGAGGELLDESFIMTAEALYLE